MLEDLIPCLINLVTEAASPVAIGMQGSTRFGLAQTTTWRLRISVVKLLEEHLAAQKPELIWWSKREVATGLKSKSSLITVH